MKQKTLRVLLLLIILLNAVFLISCSDNYTGPVNLPEEGDETPDVVLYKITVDNGAEIVVYEKEADVSLTVTAADKKNMVFTGWEYEGKTVSSDKTYTFTVKENASLNAKYITSYTIHLDAGLADAEYEAVTVGEGQDYTLPVPVLENYYFLGWYDGIMPYTDENGNSLKPFSAPYDVTLKAEFREKPVYTVIWQSIYTDENGQEAVYAEESQTKHLDEQVTLTAVAVPDNRFVGWYDENDRLVSQETDYTFTVTSDVTFRAKYEEAFTVSVLFGSGSGTYAKGTVIEVKAQTTPTGKYFVGWRYIGESELLEGEQYKNTSFTLEVTESVSYEAVFEFIDYTLTFTMQGGSYGDTPVTFGEPKIMHYGDEIIPPSAPSETHYVFAGWSSYPSRMPADDLTISGRLIPEKHTVTVNGGIISANGLSSGVFDYGTEITIAHKEITGKRFLYWEENGAQVTSASPYTFTVERNVTLTAVYEDILYKLTYYVYGAEYGVDGGVYREFELKYKDPTVSLPAISKEHYTFSGWSRLPQEMPASNYTVTGTFIVDRHTLSVNNGYINGDETLTEGVFDWNESVTVTAVIPVGKQFNGWYLGDIRVSQEVEYTFPLAGNTYLEARTDFIQYDLVFMVSGQTGTEGFVEYHRTTSIYNSTVRYPANPSEANKQFGGWSTSPDEMIAPPEKMPAENLTLYGKLSWVKHKITLVGGVISEVNGVEVENVSQATYDYGTELTVVAQPDRGYHFTGWTINGQLVAGAEQEYSFTLVREFTLTATFAQTEYEAVYYTKLDSEDEYTEWKRETFYYNENYTLAIADEKPHYDFDGWYDADGGKAAANLITPDANLAFYGVYNIHRHQFTVVNGTIAGYDETSVTVPYGTRLTIEATVPVGKVFRRWTSSNLAPVTVNPYNATVTGDVTWTAEFAVATYTLDVTDGRIKSVDGVESSGDVYRGTYEYGTTIVLQPKNAEAGKVFSHWEFNGESVSEGMLYSFEISENVEAVAVFENILYTVTYYVGGAGNDISVPFDFNDDARPNPITEGFISGEGFAPYATPDYIEHYHFSGWYFDENLTEPAGSYVTVAYSDIKIYGKYILDTHTLTVNGGSGSGTYNYGDTVTAEAEIPVGQSFVKWVDTEGTVLSTEAIYSFTLEKDTEITAVYEYIDYTLTFMLYGAEHGETGYAHYTETLHYGDTVNIQSLPADKENYAFSGWYVEGEDTIPATMPDSDLTVRGDYEYIYVMTDLGDGTYSVAANTAVKGTYPSTITVPSVYNGKPVVSVDSRGFADMTELTDVTIPESVTVIGDGAFSGCTSLISMTIPVSGGDYFGYMFGATSADSQVAAVPSSLTEVVYNGTTIPEKYFYKLTSLKTVTFPNTETVGNSAFDGAGLTSLTLPETLTTVGEYAFANLNYLAYIEYRVTDLFDFASKDVFERAGRSVSSLEVVFVDGVTHIPANMFAVTDSTDRAQVTAVTFPTTLESVGGYAFQGQDKFTADIVLPEGVTTIGASAFAGIESTRVVIPSTVTSIGSGAFSAMTSLAEVEYNAVNATTNVSEGLYAFREDGNEFTVTIGSAVQTVPDNLFRLSGVTEVTFAENGSLTNIGSYAFADSKLASVSLSGNLMLGEKAFYGCASLGSVYYNVPNAADFTSSSLVFGSSSQTAGYAVTIGKDVIRIPSYLFGEPENDIVNYVNATTVTFESGSSCKEIAPYAFANGTLGGSLEIPFTVRAIGEYGFYGNNLATISLPSTTTTIGAKALAGNGTVTVNCQVGFSFETWATDWVDDNATVNYSVGAMTDGDFSYVVNEGRAYITHYHGTGDVVVGKVGTEGGTKEGYDVYGVGLTFNENTSITSVTLPATVAEIQATAFEGCTSLASFTHNGNVTVIGSKAFYGCNNLSTLVLNFTGSEIGSEAFAECGKLTSFDFETVTSIGDKAFANSGLTSADLSAAVVIGNEAFADCTSLTSVTLSSVEIIGTGAFASCSSLREFIFSGNDYYELRSDALCGALCGALYRISDNTLLYYPASSGATSFAVPDGTESIADGAFANAVNLTEITLPSTLTSIGKGAFAGCVGLATVNINSVALNDLTADSDIFSGATSLTVNVNEGVTRLPDYLFDGATVSAVTLPTAGLTYIGKYAFYNNTMTALTIPDSVTEIGEYAFYGSTLETLYYNANVESFVADENGNTVFGPMASGAVLDLGANVTVIGDNFLYNSNLAVVNHGTSQVERIGENAFRGTSLTSVTIYESVTDVGSYAFAEITTLNEITVESSANFTGTGIFDGSGTDNVTFKATGTNVSSGLFASANQPALTSITLENTETVGDEAFDGISTVTTLSLPSTLTTIGSRAFAGMNGISVLTVPENVTTIGNEAFYGWDGLTELNFNATSVADFEPGNGIFGVAAGVNRSYKLNIGTSVTKVPALLTVSDALNDTEQAENAQITEVAFLGNAVTEIGHYAFAYLTNATVTNFPTAVETIGSYAFHKTAIGALTLTAATSIGEYAFNSASLTSIAITSPSYTIGSYAFGANETLSSAELGDGVTAIGQGAFAYCTTLSNVNMTNNDITNIGQGAFEGCALLTSFNLGTKITNVAANLFDGCASLASITIPDSVISIGAYAFRGCALTSITLGENLTSLGEGAFADCKSVTEINYRSANLGNVSETASIFSSVGAETSGVTLTIDSAIRKLPDYLFYVPEKAGSDGSAIDVDARITAIEYEARVGETADISLEIGLGTFKRLPLADVTLPDFVTKVGKYAFQNCEDATTLTWGEGLLWIGYGAFSGMTAVTEFNHNAVNLGEDNFIPQQEAGENPPNNDVFYKFGNNVTMNVGVGVTKIHKGMFVVYTDEEALNKPQIKTLNLSSTVTEIGDNAFCDVATLTTVDFTSESGLERIGNYAFSGASLNSVPQMNYAAANGVSVGGYAFADNSELTSITLYLDVVTLGTGAFENCVNVTEVILTAYDSAKSAASYPTVSADTFVNLGKNTAGVKVTVDNVVKMISNNIFYTNGSGNSAKITEVYLNKRAIASSPSDPNDFTHVENYERVDELTIGNNAFRNIGSLTTLTFEGMEHSGFNYFRKITSVGSYAFYGTNLGGELLLHSEGGTAIGDYAFYATDITVIKLYSNTTINRIGEHAFAECRALEGMTLIKDFPIYRMESGLKELVYPVYTSTVMGKVGAYAFQNAVNFNFDIMYPLFVSIGEYAFDGCSLLTNIGDLSHSNELTSVGAYAFRGTNINTVYSLSTLPSDSTTEGAGSYVWTQKSPATIALPDNTGMETDPDAFSGMGGTVTVEQ